jgi:dUTP pyrophosphatase
MELLVKRLSPTAKLPIRGSEEAAGYDLSACLIDENGNDRGKFTKNGTITILPGHRAIVPTGIAFTTPKGTYGRIAPRSGLAYKQGVDLLGAVIDRDYTDEAGAIIINLGQETFVIEHDMRIAQLVLEKIETPEVQEVDELEKTHRGSGGFGSTGTK